MSAASVSELNAGSDEPVPEGGASERGASGGVDSGDAAEAVADRGGLARASMADVAGRALTLLGFVIGSRVIADNSFLTHLATGAEIAAAGGVPSVDVYSYVAAGDAWTVQSWLPSMVYHLLNDSLGGWAVRAFNGLLVAALVHHLWKLLAPVEQLIPRIILAGGCVLIGAHLWTPRPLLIGLLAMVLLMRVLRRDLRLLWVVPIVYVWVNSHGSFPLAGVYLGLVVVGGWLDSRTLDRWHLKVAAATALSAGLAVLNPVGWRLLWFPVHLLGRREALESVAEWSPPSFESSYEWVFVGLLGLLLFAARRSAPWQALLPSAVFALSALLAVRNLGFASIIIAVSIAPGLKGLLGSVVGDRRTGAGAAATAVVLLCFGVVAFSLLGASPTNLERYPVAEMAWLEQRSLVANDEVRIAQRDFVGNYMTFKYGSEARVFVDDRFDFYPQAVLDDHRHLVFGGDFDEIVERRAFNVAVWEADSAFGYWLADSEEWRIARSSDDWLVACRVDSALNSRCR